MGKNGTILLTSFDQPCLYMSIPLYVVWVMWHFWENGIDNEVSEFLIFDSRSLVSSHVAETLAEDEDPQE